MFEGRFLRIEFRVWLVLLAYAAIAIVVFWPLLAHASSVILQPNYASKNATPDRDAYHFIWNYWWVKTSIGSSKNILFTNLFFYPQGTSLALQTIDYTDAAISAPLSTLVGNLAAYNYTLVLSFILSGFTACLLAKRLTKSWIAGFGAGLIFAYAPQHVNQTVAGHPNVASIEWLPALALTLILTYEKWQLRYAVLSGVLLAVLTYTDPEMLILGLIVVLFYLIYHLLTTRLTRFRKFLILTMVIIFVFAGLTAPYLIPAYQALGVVHAAPPVAQDFVNSAKPLLYLTPSPTSLIYSGLFSSIYTSKSLSGGFAQWVIFVGYSTLALALLGLLLSTDRKRFLFLALAGVAFICSLGPSPNPSVLSIQTPYTILYNHFSILQYFRAEARYSILLMMSLSILAAYGIVGILQLVSITGTVISSNKWKIAGIIILAIIAFEFAPAIRVGNAPNDPIYAKIAADKSQFAVLELPTTITVGQQSLYEQTIFQKPLVNGKISQTSNAYPTYLSYQLFLCELSSPGPCAINSQIIVQPYNQSDLAPVILSYYNIKYIIVNIHQMKLPAYERAISILSASFGSPYYSDDNVAVYSLPNFLTNGSIVQMAQSGPLAFFGSGWVRSGGQYYANDSAQIVVYSAESGTYNVAIKSSASPLCMTNSMTDQSVQCGSYDLSTGTTTYQMSLNQGENILNLQVDRMSTIISTIQITSQG